MKLPETTRLCPRYVVPATLKGTRSFDLRSASHFIPCSFRFRCANRLPLGPVAGFRESTFVFQIHFFQSRSLALFPHLLRGSSGTLR